MTTPIATQKSIKRNGTTYTATKYYSLRQPYMVEDQNGKKLGEVEFVNKAYGKYCASCANGAQEYFGCPKSAVRFVIKSAQK